MEIRRLIDKDAREFYNCLKIIDSETNFMMFEPDERVWNEEKLVKILKDENNLFLGAVEDDKINILNEIKKWRYYENRTGFLRIYKWEN